jgi:predicted PurR-regulated permease PerM
MLPENTSHTPDLIARIVRIAFAAAVLWAVVRLLGYLGDVLIPFAVALLLAYLVDPLVRLAQRKIPNRVAAVFLCLVGLVCLAALVAGLLVPAVVREMAELGRLLSRLAEDSNLASRVASVLPPELWQEIKSYASEKEVRGFLQSGDSWRMVGTALRKILPGAWGVVSGLGGFVAALAGLAAVGLYFVFLLLDFHKVRGGWRALVPPAHRDGVVAFVGEFDAAMSRYFRAQAVVATIVGVLFAIGFTLVGLPMGILLGLFIGLLNMVPYLQLVGLIPAGLLAVMHGLESGGDIWIILAQTGLVFVVVQAVQDVLLVPRIMGRVTGLSPAFILLALAVWGKLLGLLGLLIAIPATCLCLAWYHRYLAEAELEAQASEEDADPHV